MIFVSSCEQDVYGCLDSQALNYNSDAIIDNNSCEYFEIGAAYQGGIVFYIDETGEHGLVAALEDLPSTYQWGCFGTGISGADGQAIGTGYQNTLDIVAGCNDSNTAAFVSLNANIEGYKDWYLPSKDELMEMYHTIGQGGANGNLGSFDDTIYWSSSGCGNGNAWLVTFADGYAYGSHDIYTNRVRVIRAF